MVGQCRNGQALEQVLAHKPDVLLTDIEMPELTGLELAAELKRRRIPTRVIILTTFARAGYLRRALEAGASGYLLKDAPSATLADAVVVFMRGHARSTELSAEAWTGADPLTDRERQVLRMAGDGAVSADIASKLNLSRAPFGTISRKRSAKLAPRIELRRRGLQGKKAGCSGLPAYCLERFRLLLRNRHNCPVSMIGRERDLFRN